MELEINNSTVNRDPNTAKPTYVFQDAVRMAWNVNDDDELLLVLEDLNFRVIMEMSVTNKSPIIEALDALQEAIDKWTIERS